MSVVAEEKIELKETSDESRIYEVGFLIISSIPEETLPGEVGDIKGAIEKAGALFISEDYPKLTNLAYEMSKTVDNRKTRFQSAYFGWVKFETSAESIAEIKEGLKKNPNILRFIMIKTVRESTLAQRRSFGQGPMRRRMTSGPKEETQPEVPIDKEAIDKKIDELLVS